MSQCWLLKKQKDKTDANSQSLTFGHEQRLISHQGNIWKHCTENPIGIRHFQIQLQEWHLLGCEFEA